MKHPHAEKMLEYAKDAMETDRPYERWEYLTSDEDSWREIAPYHPAWNPAFQYRRKLRTIKINDMEVPEPVREPLKIGQQYFIPTLSYDGVPNYSQWDDGAIDRLRLKRGMIHLFEENAKRHAVALILVSGGTI